MADGTAAFWARYGLVTDALVVAGVTDGWNRGLMRLEPQSDFLPV